MIRLTKIRAQKYGTIKDIELDLDYTGVTVILGRNQDAGSPNYTNASGKSLLLSTIPEAAYGVPPLGKDATKHQGTTLSLEFKGAKTHEFVKTYGKSKGFQYRVDGQDKSIRGLNYTAEKLRNYLGCGTEEDFYSSVFLDSAKPHPLLTGSAAQREQFLVGLFALQDIDYTRKLLLAELREVQKAAAAYKEVKSVFEEERKKLGKLPDHNELSEKLSRLEVKQKSLLRVIQEVQKTRDILAFEESFKKQIQEFKKTTTLETLETDLEKTLEELKNLVRAKQAALEWRDYHKELVSYKKKKAANESALEKLGLTKVDPAWILKTAKVASRAKEDASRVKAEIVRVEEELAEVSKAEHPTHAMDVCARKVDRLQEELSHASHFEDGTCPTCGSKVKARPTDEISSELKIWKTRLKLARVYEESLEIEKKNKKIRQEVKELRAKLDDAQKTVKTYGNCIEAQLILNNVVEKPTRPESEKVDLEQVETKVEKLQELKSKFKSWITHRDRLYDLFSLTEEARAKAESTSDAGEKLSEISRLIADASAKLLMREELVKSLKTLKSRGKVLEKQSSDEPILKALIDIYSKDGLKKIRINSRCATLTRQLNKYARLFYAEDLEFEVSYDKRVEVLVHRKRAKSVNSTDVKRLSGAERMLFTLALVVATRSMKPKNQRSNVLILDEPESKLGPGALDDFVRVLPILNSVVPHIVVITPKSDLQINGARYFTVVKKNGVSSLVKGKA